MSTLQARSEAVLNASVSRVWAIVTDITLLPRINPGVIKASGAINEPNAARTCEVENKGRKAIITEKLVEFVPGKRMVWRVESDTVMLNRLIMKRMFASAQGKILQNLRTLAQNQ